MRTNKASSSKAQPDLGETKYKTDVLLKSKALSQYQIDFAKVLLTKDEYTIGEARAILDHFCGKEGDE